MSTNLRINGEVAPVPSESLETLDRIRELADTKLRAPTRLFLSFSQFSARTLGSVGVTGGSWPVVAEASGASVPEAIDEAAASLSSLLARCGNETALPPRPQVSEVLMQCIRFPSEDPPRDLAGYRSSLEERFIYHLESETAHAIAQRSNSSCFPFARKDTHEICAYILMGGQWFLVEDIERKGWAAGSSDRTEVLLAGVEADDRIVVLQRDRFLDAGDIAEATKALDASGEQMAVANIRSLNKQMLLVRDRDDTLRGYSYELDPWSVSSDTGPFGVPTWSTPPASSSKEERLTAIIACPSCGAGLRNDLTMGKCAQCGAQFRYVDGTFDFIESGSGAVIEDPDASRNSHSKQLVHDIRLFTDGLVLNAGAGDTLLSEPNLINLEIVRYAHTDVVGDGQRLPFADESFDMVFSQSVVEHVPDPFKYARELLRVLKQGGMIFVDAPFMSPFHGYPNHYFNPTMNGLRQLMDETEEIGLREGPHHAPGEALFTFMSHWVRALRTEDARNKLLAMPVGEFLDRIRGGRDPEVTKDLDRAQTFTISAGFAFYGRKK